MSGRHADPIHRNDENVIVSQLQGLFLRFQTITLKFGLTEFVKYALGLPLPAPERS
jgi:hypothetical protein